MLNRLYKHDESLNDDLLKHFWVVTCISNPVRYNSRYRLYSRFAKQMEDAGIKLVTVEQAFGDRPFEITQQGNPYHLQVRTLEEVWHKENMLDLGIQHITTSLDPNAGYFATVDADVAPMMPMKDWMFETFHELQHNHVVQMFETAYDLNPDDIVINNPQVSFMSKYIKTGCVQPVRGGFWTDEFYTVHGHPGFAWGYTRDAIDRLGGLIDFAVLGAGDRHMCLGLVGCMDQSFENKTSGYVRELMQWEARAERWIKRDVGYVKASLYHYWHGKKKDRGYTDRWKILRDNSFDPSTDLKYDAQGLLQLETWDLRQMNLRDQIRAYMRSRNEDSIDT